MKRNALLTLLAIALVPSAALAAGNEVVRSRRPTRAMTQQWQATEAQRAAEFAARNAVPTADIAHTVFGYWKPSAVRTPDVTKVMNRDAIPEKLLLGKPAAGEQPGDKILAQWAVGKGKQAFALKRRVTTDGQAQLLIATKEKVGVPLVGKFFGAPRQWKTFEQVLYDTATGLKMSKSEAQLDILKGMHSFIQTATPIPSGSFSGLLAAPTFYKESILDAAASQL